MKGGSDVSLSSLLRLKIVAVAVGLFSASAVGVLWLLTWYVTALYLSWVFWKRPVAEYLEPSAVIPLPYLPFLARSVVLRLTNDTRAAGTALWIGIALAAIASYSLLVARYVSGSTP